MGQWFWIGDVDEPSTTKEKKKKSSPKVEADSKKPVDSKKRSASKGEEKEKVIKKPRSVKEQPDQPIETRKRKTRSEKHVEPIPAAPMTKKDQKQEILDFLLKMRGVSEDDAKSTLKGMLPNYSANRFDCSPDIYWVRKGVKGIGCGVRCESEGKSVGFFAYRAQCNDWIFAIAAAIKSADILVTPMHYSHFTRPILECCVQMIFSFHKSWIVYRQCFLTGFFEARYIHGYQKENPDSEVSLQADPEVRKVRDAIAKVAGKALQDLSLSIAF